MVMTNKMLALLGRNEELFIKDIQNCKDDLNSIVGNSSFLVLGAAGSIGQSVTKEIFKRNPTKLHVVDISENNLAELVRDLRSSYGYIEGDFKSLALDIGSKEYDAFIDSDGKYDYVLNLSALKHVRSERDQFTLMRMIEVNIFNTDKTIRQSIAKGTKKYFCVSTDKAANPVNMMGASKRIMEMIKRYFIIPKEAGELCLMSCIYGENRDIFFPKLSKELHLVTFSSIAKKYLNSKGLEIHECESEEEARLMTKTLPAKGVWPCLFTSSDTTGEKDFEEFFTESEILDLETFQNLGVIKNEYQEKEKLTIKFEKNIKDMKKNGNWSKGQLIDLFNELIPNFNHMEKGKHLDAKM